MLHAPHLQLYVDSVVALDAFQPDYLRASSEAQKQQTLCGNIEGWGPISPFRYDFTPCFLDVWITAVGFFGILLGSGAIWYLRKKTPAVVRKDWHFYTKLSIIGALIIITALQACLQIEALPDIWFRDFRFWTSIIILCSIVIIGGVQILEHWRSRQPNGVVLFYWLFLLIAYGVKLRSLISQKSFQTRLPYFVTFCIGFALAALEFALEYLVPKKQSAYDALGDEDECPIEYADVFSALTFGWMTPLMKYGYKEYLTQDDLWNLRKRDTAQATGGILENAWAIELEKKRSSLWMAMFRGFSGPYLRGSVIKSISDLLQFCQPQLLRLLISFVESYRDGNPHPQPVIRGAAIAIAMFAVSVLQTVSLHQYFQRAFETGMRIKSGLTAMIYAKSMKLSNEGRASKSTGDIVNYMAVDTQRLQDLTQYGQMLWSAPFQIALCMASLYQLVGWSMLAGVGVMIFMIPINGVIARIMKTLQKSQMKNKDARTRLMTEILNNIKSIKLFAWGQAFMNKLRYIRNDQELHTLRKIGAVQAVANFTWSTTPFLVSCCTFVVFVLTTNQPLTTEIVFPALTLFNLLTFPLAILPMVITAIVEATVAVGRLTSYFTAEELQPDAVIAKEPALHIGDDSVRVRDASFTWDRKEGKRCLENIDLEARKGDLSCIVGRVGSGKSSLLQAMLGDIWKIHGEIVLHGSVAYVAQQPWVMNATIRDNIVFGHRWDPHFYERTVNACALAEDFKTLPNGDQTEVGERGISLSGGQKARVALARAVYARADVYLLDDCLSAVDQHVGRHLIDKVLGSSGLLASKTRVLATNSIPVLAEADFITLMRDGKILEKGTYKQLMAMKGEFASLIRTAKNEEEDVFSTPEGDEGSVGTSEAEDSTAVTTDVSSQVEGLDEMQEGLSQLTSTPGGAVGENYEVTEETLRRASTVSFKGHHGRVTDEEADGAKSRQSKEFSEQGKVKWNVYGEYAKTSNLVAVGIYLVMLFAAQTAQVGGSLWLKRWSEVNQASGGNPEVGKYIGIYFAFGIGSSALVVAQTLILWIFCSIEVGGLSTAGFHAYGWKANAAHLVFHRLLGSFTSEWLLRYSDRQ